MKRSLAFVYAAFCLRYLYPLVLVPFYARTLGVGEYGRVLAANSITMLVWAALDYGFPSCGARDAASSHDGSALARLYGRHVSGRLVMMTPALLIGAVATISSPVLRERPLFGVLATIGGIVNGFNLGWYFQGTQRFVTSVILEVIGTVINLPLMLWLVRDDGAVVLWLNIGVSALVSCIAHYVASRTLDRRAISIRGGFTLVREATPLFAHRGFGMLLQSGAIYVVSLFASARGVGLYGSAEKLVGLGLSAMAPAGQVLINTISKRLADGDDGVFVLIRKAMIGVVVLAAVGCGAGMGLAKFLVPIALGSGFEGAIPIVQVLLAILPFAALSQAMSGYVLIPLRSDRVVSTGSVINFVVALSLMSALVSRFGLFGVAGARVIAEAAVALFLTAALQRKQLWRRIWGERAAADSGNMSRAAAVVMSSERD
jgi:PST family polysaccharide transporter